MFARTQRENHGNEQSDAEGDDRWGVSQGKLAAGQQDDGVSAIAALPVPHDSMVLHRSSGHASALHLVQERLPVWLESRREFRIVYFDQTRPVASDQNCLPTFTRHYLPTSNHQIISVVFPTAGWKMK